MLEVKLLGQFEALRDGDRLNIPTRNAQSLFAYLLLHAGKMHRREKLAGLLWPDSSEENARSNLRHELWRLRKALDVEEKSYFLVDDLTIAFNSQSKYSLDVHKLEEIPLQGSSPDELIEALSPYIGELLPGFYDEWIFVERGRLHALYEAKIAHLLELLQQEGRWGEVIDWGMRWIRLGGWPEPAYRALMSAYANRGELSKAVVTYERYTQALQKEAGIKPSEQTQALYKRLRAGWKTDTKSQPLARASQPEISPMQLPAPASTLPKLRRSNLPKPLTSFIGREQEIQEVKGLVSKARLVTVTGPGGVGKTRLAIQAASALTHQFKDGAWWMELASISGIIPAKRDSGGLQMRREELTGADLIIQAIAKVLRVPESPGLPLLEGVLEHLHDKKLLLVLDNCEHLIDACATLVERVLGDCPDVTILATSREPLGVAGEKAWVLPSLSLPGQGHSLDTSNIFQSEAVSLFIERAADVLPGYQPGEEEAPKIAQICLRLDGIPLAIELAAARMNLLSAQEIAARLDRRFSLLTEGSRTALPRHQTLLAAIEWSHDLLSESERVLFRRLSIFAGSFTLEAAEIVCASDPIHPEEVLTLVGRLVDKSLLTVDASFRSVDLPTRFRFLDTICSFGRLKLEVADETKKMQHRHADYYVRLVEAAETELLLSDQVYWFKLLQAENDNLHAVVDRSCESDQAESALRLVGALWFFWWSQSSSREGNLLTLKALSLPSAAQYVEYRAKALNTAGILYWLLGETVFARQSLEEALSMLKATDDQASLARSFLFLGLVYISDQEFALAESALQEALDISRKLEDEQAIMLMFFQGDLYLQKGDLVKAKDTYEVHINSLRAVGNKVYAAYPLRRLGYLALEQNDTSLARKYFQESLAINREVADRRAVCACLTSLAALAIHLGKPVLAARLYGAVEIGLESHSILLFYQDQIELGRIRNNLLKSLDEVIFNAAFNEGWEMSEAQIFMLVEEAFREKSLAGTA